MKQRGVVLGGSFVGKTGREMQFACRRTLKTEVEATRVAEARNRLRQELDSDPALTEAQVALKMRKESTAEVSARLCPGGFTAKREPCGRWRFCDPEKCLEHDDEAPLKNMNNRMKQLPDVSRFISENPNATSEQIAQRMGKVQTWDTLENPAYTAAELASFCRRRYTTTAIKQFRIREQTKTQAVEVGVVPASLPAGLRGPALAIGKWAAQLKHEWDDDQHADFVCKYRFDPNGTDYVVVIVPKRAPKDHLVIAID
ncbi:hypothetical protein DIPPA_12162, partial [Diplonema papillatum]